MRNDRTYIEHIAEAIDTIEGYLKEVDYEKFSSHKMISDAVVRELEIIGEAANNISEQFQKEHLEVPWNKMVGIRNILVHEYFGVNLKVVWETCQHDLKELRKIIKPIL